MDTASAMRTLLCAVFVSSPLLAQTPEASQQSSQSLQDTEQQPADEGLMSMGTVVVIGTASQERTKYESSVAISTFTAEDIEQ